MSMTLSEARRILNSESLRFASPHQAEAVQTIERKGRMSDSQLKRWHSQESRLRKIVRHALGQRVIICPCCGKAPWQIRAAARCLPGVIGMYGLEGCPRKWFVVWAREWYDRNRPLILTPNPK